MTAGPVEGSSGDDELAGLVDLLRGTIDDDALVVDLGHETDGLAGLDHLVEVRALPSALRPQEDGGSERLAEWFATTLAGAVATRGRVCVRLRLDDHPTGDLATLMPVVEKYGATVLLTGLGPRAGVEVVETMAGYGYVTWASSDTLGARTFITDGSVSERALLAQLTARDTRASSLDEEVAQLRGQLHRVNLRYREAAQAHARLKRQLEEARTALQRRDDQLVVAAGDLARAAERLAASSERADQARREVADLRGSVTFRVGQEVRRATRSLGAALALPWRLVRILRDGPGAAARRDDDEEVAVGGSVAAPVHGPVPTGTPRVRAEQHRRRLTDELVDIISESSGSRRTRLRVSAIVDEFTETCLAPDCHLTNLTRGGWESELEESEPQLLFVESAWRGSGGTWHNAVSEFGVELRGILAWCAQNGVPTVFWNKEDPVHFATFINAAARFEHVFTTDLDCVPRYKAALGHDRVYLLPFAAQPRVHNPIETMARKSAFSFAGAYYRKYPERSRDLDSFLDNLPSWRPVEIFDRNLGGADENYRFPEKYHDLIVGTLGPSEIAEAYKAYEYGINLNSVKQSQSMFARRVFELLGSNTLTVSNYSRAIDLLFGDLVIATDSGAQAVRRLRDVARDPDVRDRVRLAGVRSVLLQHTYEHRLAYVVQKVVRREVRRAAPRVALVGQAVSQAEADQLLASMDAQRGVEVTPIVVVRGAAALELPARVTVLRERDVSRRTVEDVVASEFFALLSPRDHYGPHYALDLALAARYSDAEVFGKGAHFVVDAAGSLVVQPGPEYRSLGAAAARSSLARTEAFAGVRIGPLLSRLATATYRGHEVLAVDRFSYCEDGAGRGAEVTSRVDDLELDLGLPLERLQSVAEHLGAADAPDEDERRLSPATLSRLFAGISRPGLSHAEDADEWVVTSELDDGVHEYVYGRGTVPVEDLWAFSGEGHAYLDAEPGLNIQVVFIFHDAAGERLGAFFAVPQQNAAHPIPAGTTAVKIGIRAQGAGVARVRGVALVPRATLPGAIVHTGDHLVLTNHYPAYDDLYRNGFVHTRVRSYVDAGMSVDVFRLRADAQLRFDEFEGVSVMSGSAAALERLLELGSYASVLVHFLDEAMWSVLQRQAYDRPVVVWIHGAEVQPWWRRAYNYDDDALLEAAKEESARRLQFWAQVFTDAPANVHFVFVSRYFAQEVIADVGVALAPERYSVIHNPIDTQVFDYVPKPASQRLKILSIRPFASAKYANDLTVAAVLELSRESWFHELDIRIVGDGPLFEETLAPIVGLENVTIERRFLTQAQIVELHREYGVFLVPTRMDAQGVSRDEAMASGLVPITNAVAAIPEFVDAASGILAAPEDAHGLAAGIRTLREEPGLFEEMSRAAASRVRRQSSAALVRRHETDVILGRDAVPAGPGRPGPPWGAGLDEAPRAADSQSGVVLEEHGAHLDGNGR